MADRPLVAGAVVVLSLLATGCGAATSTTTTSTRSSQLNAALAFSHCMRAHGVPAFPDPDSQGNFTSFQTGVSKQISTAANETCKHLLPNVGGGGAVTGGDQKKLAFALKTAQCMRRHGYPTYPDPTTASASSQGSGTRFRGTGIDPKSPQFQTAETACEKQSQKALGLS